jgi:hypothetical protein
VPATRRSSRLVALELPLGCGVAPSKTPRQKWGQIMSRTGFTKFSMLCIGCHGKGGRMVQGSGTFRGTLKQNTLERHTCALTDFRSTLTKDLSTSKYEQVS